MQAAGKKQPTASSDEGADKIDDNDVDGVEGDDNHRKLDGRSGGDLVDEACARPGDAGDEDTEYASLESFSTCDSEPRAAYAKRGILVCPRMRGGKPRYFWGAYKPKVFK